MKWKKKNVMNFHVEKINIECSSQIPRHGINKQIHILTVKFISDHHKTDKWPTEQTYMYHMSYTVK